MSLDTFEVFQKCWDKIERINQNPQYNQLKRLTVKDYRTIQTKELPKSTTLIFKKLLSTLENFKLFTNGNHLKTSILKILQNGINIQKLVYLNLPSNFQSVYEFLKQQNPEYQFKQEKFQIWAKSNDYFDKLDEFISFFYECDLNFEILFENIKTKELKFSYSQKNANSFTKILKQNIEKFFKSELCKYFYYYF